MDETFYRFDIFSLLILAGAVQGFFLSYVFLKKDHTINRANRLLGFLLLALALCIFEIFLNYSGLLLKVMWLDNFSEPFIFLFGPLVYLYIVTSINENSKITIWPHLIWFEFYCLYHLLYIIQPADLKYDIYIQMYGLNLPIKQVRAFCNPDPLHLRMYVNQILAVHWAIYISLASFTVYKAYQTTVNSIFSLKESKYSWYRNILFHLWVSFLIFITAKLTFGRDLGDYLIASYLAAIIYIISFNVVKKSLFFKPENTIKSEGPKYVKSPLSETDKLDINNKLQKAIIEEKCYTNNLLSLNDLAKKIGVPPHHLSQVINELTNKTFFEYIAEYRINEAKRLLKNEGAASTTIEEVAEQVGYNSKSAFNKTFKKLTGITPSEFRENM